MTGFGSFWVVNKWRCWEGGSPRPRPVHVFHGTLAERVLHNKPVIVSAAPPRLLARPRKLKHEDGVAETFDVEPVAQEDGRPRTAPGSEGGSLEGLSASACESDIRDGKNRTESSDTCLGLENWLLS